MSVARHHAEWLSLLEISGPFLSMPVLMDALPQGLPADDPAAAQELRAAYEEWLDNQGGLQPDPAIHHAWIRYVLGNTLELTDEVLAEGQAIPAGLKASVPEHHETLRPDLVVHEPDGGKARMLIQVYPATQGMEDAVPGRAWKAGPATRMMELLHATEVRLGLVTNGEQWLLVQAKPGESTGYAGWYANLWPEERLTLRAFQSLLGVQRFFGVPEEDTLEGLLERSAKDQHEVTDQLGSQVRQAVEILIQAVDRADQDRGRKLLASTDEERLYEAALTVMMRLVFLLAAEERGLLLLGDPTYDQNYAISTLRGQLREMADRQGEEVLERRYDAWCRLLATFRAVYGGVQHENLRLPAYGGSLFDPDRFPFLEGRQGGTDWRTDPADPLPIDNRVVLHLLEALQVLQVPAPGGLKAARTLSFRALDIEQIGHVYEGLLDHQAVRAAEPVLGLQGTRYREPEIPLAELESQLGKGEKSFIAYLKEQTGRSPGALRNALNDGPDALDVFRAQRLRAACGNDEALYRRVLPFAGLVRDDDYGVPVVIPAGSVYVTEGATRRQTGTHYTPRSLTEPIVQHTLEPLVYVGPAEGLPPEEWQLRSPKELLGLKVCDMAMGSGAFLVQACRYLSERLVEAWAEVSGKLVMTSDSPADPQSLLPDPRITPEGRRATGDPAETIIPKSDEERLTLARRLVVDRCLYGVDKNHLAVEMAKLSLWLITLDKNRPFTFLDHALRHGDSLIGADEEMFLRWAHSITGKPEHATTASLFEELNRLNLEEAKTKRRQLQAFEVRDIRDAERKAQLLAQAEAATEQIKLGCDLLVGIRMLPDLTTAEQEVVLANALIDFTAGKPFQDPVAKRAVKVAQDQPSFHWSFEFPEVHAVGGFSAFIGNPPFMGGRLIGNALGDGYRDFLAVYRRGRVGSADLCVYFLLNAFRHLSRRGCMGFITTNSIVDTGTRTVGLEQIVATQGGQIYAAEKNRQWPGAASVVASLLSISKGPWRGKRVLDQREVDYISSRLDPIPTEETPYQLMVMTEKNSQGYSIMGEGFVLSELEKDELIAAAPRNRDVIFGYFNGSDLNSLPRLEPRRWIINFADMTYEEASSYAAPFQRVEMLVKPYRDSLSGQIHEDCFWKYWDRRPRLQPELEAHKNILASAITTKYVSFQFVPTDQVYNHAVKLYFFYTWPEFSVLQSSIHQEWAIWRSSSLGNTVRYSTSEALDTFPFPPVTDLGPLNIIGKQYHEQRARLIEERQQGLTGLYNSFHDPDETNSYLGLLRELHVELDSSVGAAYGWNDIDLGHGFHETEQGIRFTISERARRQVLTRLLKLNHERYAEEVRLGLHETGGKGKKAGGKKRAKGKKGEGQMSLF